MWHIRSQQESAQVITTGYMKLCIPQATEKGFIEVEPNGAFDWAYPTSKTRRGRVQMGGAVTPALTCSTEIYVYEVIYEI